MIGRMGYVTDGKSMMGGGSLVSFSYFFFKKKLDCCCRAWEAWEAWPVFDRRRGGGLVGDLTGYTPRLR